MRLIYYIWFDLVGYLKYGEGACQRNRNKGGERVWPGIIQLPLQADILRKAQLNRPLYDKKLVALAQKDITIIPYVMGYFMKGSEFDVKLPVCFLCGKVH